eukprot:NODE_898_length_3314_cov_0.110319.p1 type:complete len:792 gc:universal NODE_898_length_3314_cov_0.110319:2542-167(-)
MKPISISCRWMFTQVFRLMRNPDSKLKMPSELIHTANSAISPYIPGKRALLKWLWKYHGKQLLVFGLLKIIWGLFTWTAAYYVFIGLLSTKDDNVDLDIAAFKWAAFMLICCLGATVSTHHSNYLALQHSIRIKSALTILLYNKLLKTMAREPIADIVAIVATHVPCVAQAARSFHILWTAPFEVITIFALGSKLVGIAVLPALGMFLIFLPINLWIGVSVAKTVDKATRVTLDRVQKVLEILPVMKLIKFYVWEKHFQDDIEKDRKVEEKLHFRKLVLRACNYTVVFVFPVFTIWITLWTFQLLGGSINPIVSFVCLNLFNTLRYPLLLLPNTITDFVGAIKGIKSIEIYLNHNEIDYQSNTEPQDYDIDIKDAEFAWNEDKSFNLKIEELKIKHGTLVAIFGDVGSGKSSLLNAITGEMKKISGQRNVTSSLSLCPQEAWLLKETVKRNILLGAPYSEKRFKQVVNSCGLKTDLEMFKDGENMFVHEGGANLSGGQRQRVSLARSVYASSDMVLLDDPLSALDQKVGKHIFDECIKKFLHKRTVLLCTNNLDKIKHAEYIILMKHGKIACHGHTLDATKHPEFQQFYKDHSGVKLKFHKPEEENVNISLNNLTPVQLIKRSSVAMRTSGGSFNVPSQTAKEEEEGDDQVLMIDAAQNSKTNSGKVVRFYLGNTRIRVAFGLTVFLFFFTHGIRLVSDYFVKLWGKRAIDGFSPSDYPLFYLIFMVTFGAFVFLRGYCFSVFVSNRSKNIHQASLNTIFRAKLKFFEVNPVGIPIGAFAKDIYSLDGTFY